MMFGNKDNYLPCQGTIVDVKAYGSDCPPRIIVRYQVDGTDYEIKEPVLMKAEKIKLGPIPVGVRSTPVLPGTSIGDRVEVRYDPDKPSKAFIEGNQGTLHVY